MKATKYIWVNGKLVDWNNANTHVLVHGLHYGSGVFEGMRAYKINSGAAIFRLDEHIDRLFFSAQTIKLKLDYSKQELKDGVIKVVASNELQEAYIRPLAYNGFGELGVGAKNKAEVIIACWKWGSYHKATAAGLDVKTSSYIRVHPKSTIVEAKICGHYVNGIFALQEIEGTKYHEVLMLDAEGYVSECSSSNIFIVKDNILYTPGLGTILPGITRDFIIKLAIDLNYKVIEKKVTLEEVRNADEAFFSGTAVEIAFIRSLDDVNIGIEGENKVSRHLKKEFIKVVTGNNSKYSGYLTNVY